jgi:hypothetical protein
MHNEIIKTELHQKLAAFAHADIDRFHQPVNSRRLRQRT